MKRIILSLLLTGLVIVLVFSGCASPSTPVPTTTAPASSTTAPASTGQTKAAPATSGPSEILLGATCSQTGALAGFGEGAVFGLQAAVDDINKTGGVMVKELNRKLPVKLIILDDQSDYLKAATLTENLILRDKVNFLVTGGGSPPAFATTATVSQKYQMVYVGNMGPFEPYMGMRSQASPTWKYAWASGFHIAAPFAPTDFKYNKPGYTIVDVTGALLKRFADQTNKKVAIFASDEPDGRGWYTTFPAGLKQMGMTVDGADKELGMAPPNTTDFSSIIKTWMTNQDELMFGNALAPWFGTLWKQCKEMGYKPKLVYASRAALYYTDINAWGGDLPNGVGAEQFWSSSYDPKLCPGIGGTTPQSLTERWISSKNQALNQLIGFAYTTPQILFDSIERAGSLDKDKVNAALAKTDMNTTCGRATFDENNFCAFPVAWGQWFKTNKPYVWEWQTVISTVDFIPTTASPIFPIP